MKIEASAIGMSSNRTYAAYAQKSTASMITTAERAATLKLTGEGASMVEQMKEEQMKLQQEQKEQQKKNAQDLLSRSAQRIQQNQQVPEEPTSFELDLLKKMIEALKRMQGKKIQNGSMEIKQLRNQLKAQSTSLTLTGSSLQAVGGISVSNGAGLAPTQWKKTTVTSAFVTEMEHTAFEAQGIVKTADGREISFGVTMEMSRAFTAKYDSLVQEDFLLTDPLVINLDTNAANITDQKFLFDIDADGKDDEISFVGQGSGFLALDKNKDGKINDGSELFGTKSGDGFRDLAAYDKDGNGWIDENDDIFKDLKVWTKDAQGNDKLLSLKEAGVGAIYLSSANTEFSMKNSENQTNGVVRKSGIFLKESGEVSTIQHVDFAV